MRARRISIVTAAVYLMVFAAVLIKNIVWPVGDQTDVIRPGIVAFPFGLLVSFMYPGGRNGAFVAVGICGVVNTFVIYLLSHKLFGSRTREADSGDYAR